MHMDVIERAPSKGALLASLDNLKNTLDAAYEDALARIEPKDKDIAYNVFSYVTNTMRPLSRSEIQHLLGLPADDVRVARIVSICNGLVKVQNKCIQFFRE